MQFVGLALILRRFAAKLKPGFAFTKNENPAEVPQDLATIYGGNWTKFGARSLKSSGPFGGFAEVNFRFSSGCQIARQNLGQFSGR